MIIRHKMLKHHIPELPNNKILPASMPPTRDGAASATLQMKTPELQTRCLADSCFQTLTCASGDLESDLAELSKREARLWNHRLENHRKEQRRDDLSFACARRDWRLTGEGRAIKKLTRRRVASRLKRLEAPRCLEELACSSNRQGVLHAPQPELLAKVRD